jgi:DNA polymerase-3 subunit gamma/tau
MYTVLARKWRPANFEELVGQKHVHRTLTNAISSDRLAHAYIFAGLRGTGKTTVARILAKCLNCEQGPTTTPCGKCDGCVEIAESRAMDVLEIDAASRTKVEQTRELLELVAYAPVRDRYKVLIIDEAHMLSKASFNALLKTLEEPPPNVVFVMATTEIGKLLPTILSRCQVFEFRRVATRELVDHLRRICDTEEVKISDSSLERIARAGEGSVRDSLSVLERVLAFCGREVDDDDLLRLLGGVRAEVLAELLGSLAHRDAGGMLHVLDGVIDEGHDLLPFWREWISSLRDLLLLRAVGESAQDLLSRSPEEAQTLAASVASMSVEDLTRAFQLLADLEFPLRSSSQPRFLFEAAMIRLAGMGAVKPIEQLLQQLRSGGSGEAGGSGGSGDRNPKSGGGSSSRPAARPTPGAASRSRAPTAAATAAAAVTPSKAAPATAARPRASLGADASNWVAAVRDAKPMIGAILEQADGVMLDGQALVLSYDPTHRVIADRLKETETLEFLRAEAARVVDGPVNIRIEIGGEGAAPAATTPAAQPAAPQPASARPPAEPTAAVTPRQPSSMRAPGEKLSPKEKSALIDQAKSEPGVQKLLREFGAQVVDIRPLDAQPIIDDTGETD